jgi:endonuclease/exonuclease/phosphatase family metal-dependent hydrolase
MEEQVKVCVATLNLWGPGGAWDERRSVLAEGLRKMRPDVVAFQEAIVGDGHDQVKDVLGTSYHVVHQPQALVDDGNHGASIASRWPLGEVREADLHLPPRTGDYPCGTLAAEVLAPEPLGTLLFACHGPSHQPSYEYERERQAVAAARLVEELAERVGARHVVVGGDFNANPSASSVAFWRGERSLEGTSVCYLDAWERARSGEAGHTFTPRNPLVAENKPALKRAAGSTTSSCAARTPCGAPRWRSLLASSPSTSPWTGFGAATTSASSQTSPPGHRAEDPWGDRSGPAHSLAR